MFKSLALFSLFVLLVIIFDSDFNPQNDLQAMARAHRIGQTNNVVVYRLITKGTYEQKMLEIAGKKMALDTAVLGGEQSSKDDLGADEVDALLRYGAYHLFQENENDEEEKKKDQVLQEEDIDEILKRASTVVHKDEESASGGSGFSKISFCVSEKDADIDLNAEDFWERVLPDFKNLDALKQDLTEVSLPLFLLFSFFSFLFFSFLFFSFLFFSFLSFFILLNLIAGFIGKGQYSRREKRFC